MACFCYEQLLKDSANFVKNSVDFSEFGSKDKYCLDWLAKYSMSRIFLLGSSSIVIIINVIAQELFILTSRFERQVTTATENQSIFKLLFIQQFINIGIVLIMTDTNFHENYRFDSEWYVQTGSQLCFTMVVQTFSTKGSDLA